MKLSQPLIFIIFLLLIINCSKSYGQNSIMSKFYFPGQLGLSFPHVDDQKLNLKKGFMLTTALEFRPVDGNALFIRFNYDAITNHYQEVYLNSPTNVNTGKLSSSIFSLGLGYRHKAGIFKLFGLLQPGLGINNYDKVNFNTETITVEQVSRRHLSFKITAGAEYYLAEHFALTIEPSYFYLSPRGNYRLLNPQSLNLSLGFTTTLF
jgi:hypothetical protein